VTFIATKTKTTCFICKKPLKKVDAHVVRSTGHRFHLECGQEINRAFARTFRPLEILNPAEVKAFEAKQKETQALKEG
jgi:hypothetical protein